MNSTRFELNIKLVTTLEERLHMTDINESWKICYIMEFILTFTAVFSAIYIVVANNELEKRIIEAFEVFDHSGKQVVDVREVGTILRSLGCCPTEAEIQEVLLATEHKEATGTVQLEDFLPYMCKEITEHRFSPASAEMLLTAFRFFDEEKKGFLSKEKITQLMMEEGEPFTQEEFDEMMQTALDPVTDTIPYEFYINQLMVEDEVEEHTADTHPK